MFDREAYNLEYKEMVTRTYLKTVSAFSNYNDGQIIFGINDDRELVGLENPDEVCLNIENMINDSINPVPDYNLQIKDIEGKKIIVLNIFKGKHTPYYSRGKAYRRSDSSTLEVDRSELNRLVMEGINIDYEAKKSEEQDFNFKKLETKLKKTVGIEDLDLDILKTLNLYDKDGYYNIAGQLLADENNIEDSGIDIVKFGENINQILHRETFNKISLLDQYDKTIAIFERYYQYEEIEGYERIRKELIPKEAFRESLANAIVHRSWDIRAHIQISMYEDQVEISSPGGLPADISKEEYLKGNVSVLRNPIIAGVFYRLKIIEKFGTGIKRIMNEYEASINNPSFDITENNLKITLPILEKVPSNLSEDEHRIYEILQDGLELSRAQLDEKSGFNKSKTLRIINSLVDKNIVKRIGKGRGTSYKI